MAGVTKSRIVRAATKQSQRGTEEPPLVKWLLIGVAFAFLIVFLLLPLVNVFAQAFSRGLKFYYDSLHHTDTLASIRLTLLVAAISVPLNLVFGVAAAWAVAKFEFRGKSLLITLIDLPFSVSPIVAGLVYVLLFGANGWFPPAQLQTLTEPLVGTLERWSTISGLGFLAPLAVWCESPQIIFGVPGIVLATVFITFPFVARELIPVMQATGSDQEQAALTLGAGGLRTFWHVTLPSVKWGLLYGVILCNARAMGEFGAVSVVSGHIAGVTETMPLRVEQLYKGWDMAGAFAVASLLALLALFTLCVKTFLEWRQQREFERAQHAVPEQ